MSAEQRIHDALVHLLSGVSDGEHHKAEAIDEMVRILCGCPTVPMLNPYGAHGPFVYEGLGENDEYREPVEKVVVRMGERVGFTDLMTIGLDIDWKTAVAPAPAMPLPGNRKARRAQKAGRPTPTADGSRTITGKAYFRSEDGEWQELNGGKETTVTWRPA